jgi:hypothetical protein
MKSRPEAPFGTHKIYDCSHARKKFSHDCERDDDVKTLMFAFEHGKTFTLEEFSFKTSTSVPF